MDRASVSGSCWAESETIAIYCINQKSVLYPVWAPDQPRVLAVHFPPARRGERDFLSAGLAKRRWFRHRRSYPFERSRFFQIAQFGFCCAGFGFCCGGLGFCCGGFGFCCGGFGNRCARPRGSALDERLHKMGRKRVLCGLGRRQVEGRYGEPGPAEKAALRERRGVVQPAHGDPGVDQAAEGG